MRLHYPALLRENIRRGRMCPSAEPHTRSSVPTQILKKYNIKENLK